jgi:hypothetical protein
MRTFRKKMKKVLLFSLMALFTLSFISCEKEQKKYNGEAQLAFANTTYSMKVTATANTITIPVQLIASSFVDATGTVSVDPASTCANSVTFVPEFTIDPATFSYNMVITINYATLSTGKNTLILNLASPLPVAKYFSKATVTLTK